MPHPNDGRRLRALPESRRLSAHDAFGLAARAYFVYALVYAVGGTYLFWIGVGRGSRAGLIFVAAGWVLVLLIPYLLRRRRRWFERWILGRRDFARLLSVLMAIRFIEVLRVARRSDAAVATPWGGTLSYTAGAVVFALITLGALIFVAHAAWNQAEP